MKDTQEFLKGLDHSYVWWPNIDVDLEAQVKRRNDTSLLPQLHQCIPGNGQNTLRREFI